MENSSKTRSPYFYESINADITSEYITSLANWNWKFYNGFVYLDNVKTPVDNYQSFMYEIAVADAINNYMLSYNHAVSRGDNNIAGIDVVKCFTEMVQIITENIEPAQWIIDCQWKKTKIITLGKAANYYLIDNWVKGDIKRIINTINREDMQSLL